jgi:hypothetical protein
LVLSDIDRWLEEHPQVRGRGDIGTR